MGTYLAINATDSAFERMAGTSAGSAAAVRALYREFSDNGIMQDDHDVFVAADAAYRAGIAELGDGADLLENLIIESFGKLQAYDVLEAAGHDGACGGFDLDTEANRALALEVLRLQRRRWGRRSVIRLDGHRAEYAQSIRRQRLLCDRAIAAIQRGDVDSIGWG